MLSKRERRREIKSTHRTGCCIASRMMRRTQGIVLDGTLVGPLVIVDSVVIIKASWVLGRAVCLERAGCAVSVHACGHLQDHTLLLAFLKT